MLIFFCEKQREFYSKGKSYVQVIAEILRHLQLKLIFSNCYTIGCFFRQKSQVPTSLLSNAVYSCKCSQCNAAYIGETSRHPYSRYSEYFGVFPRTFKPVSSPLKSSIREHSELNKPSISISDFKVLHTCKSQDLWLAESTLILKLCPNLNTQDSSTHLKILS